MTAEMKRALVEIVDDWQGDANYAGSNEQLVDRLLARLAGGSPEVIYVMRLAHPMSNDDARAVLAAAMKKVIANG